MGRHTQIEEQDLQHHRGAADGLHIEGGKAVGQLVLGDAPGCAQNSQAKAKGECQCCNAHRYTRCLQHKENVIHGQVFFQ